MIDRAYQLAYKAAYRVMRVYWETLSPDTHGALVAIWHRGRILLVKNSYLDYWSLPGGYVRRSETAKQAALRELEEEVGLSGVPEEDLAPALDVRHRWEGKNDHVEIFDLEVDAPPPVQIDNREVVEARFFTPREALELHLFPPIARLVRGRPEPPPA